LFYKHCNKAQDFVNYWTTKLKLPTIWVKVVNNFRHTEGAIHPDSSVIILSSDLISNRRKFVKVLLHELSHWWLYWERKNRDYMDEFQAIELTEILINYYYPSYR